MSYFLLHSNTTHTSDTLDPHWLAYDLGFTYGDPEKLLYPTDSDGNVCGVGDFAWVLRVYTQPLAFLTSYFQLISSPAFLMLYVFYCRKKPNLFFFDLIACADIGSAVISTGCPTPQVPINKIIKWGVQDSYTQG